MSWSVRLIGTPEAICKALDEEEGKMSGQCLLEFQASKPSLQALLRENFNNAADARPMALRLSANGSGTSKQVTDPQGTRTEQVNRCCSVNLETLGEVLT